MIATTLLWIGIAIWGVQVMTEAIRRNKALLDVARESDSHPNVINHLANVLLLYRTRLWLIANNLGIGVAAVIVTAFPSWMNAWLGSYVVFSLLVNETSFIYLTYKDRWAQT